MNYQDWEVPNDHDNINDDPDAVVVIDERPF
jgi:hypothetical protein